MSKPKKQDPTSIPLYRERTRAEQLEHHRQVLDMDPAFRKRFQEGLASCSCTQKDLCLCASVLALADGKASYDQQRDAAILINRLMVDNDQLEQEVARLKAAVIMAAVVVRGVAPDPGPRHGGGGGSETGH